MLSYHDQHPDVTSTSKTCANFFFEDVHHIPDHRILSWLLPLRQRIQCKCYYLPVIIDILTGVSLYACSNVNSVDGQKKIEKKSPSGLTRDFSKIYRIFVIFLTAINIPSFLISPSATSYKTAAGGRHLIRGVTQDRPLQDTAIFAAVVPLPY